MWNKLITILKRIIAFPFILLIRFYQVCISPLKPPTTKKGACPRSGHALLC